MKLNKTHECLNCHEQIGNSNYCPNCGQLNTDKKLPVKQILHDFMGDYITFDSKFFRSIIPLLLKPGHLTKEYLSGKRVRFIFPFRLYLFTTFLFFFIVAANALIDKEYFNEENNSSPVIDPGGSVNIIGSDSLKSTLQEVQEELPPGISVNSENDSLTAEGKKSFGTNTTFTIDTTYYDNSIVRYLQKKANYLSSREDGSQILRKELVNQIPKVMFILLPIFALLLKLLYLRSKTYYIEHLIFSLHFHTYIFIHLIIALFLPYWWINLIIVLSISVNLFMSLRYVYGQGRIKTFFKMAVLTFFYFILMIPAFLLLIFLAVVSV